MVLVWGCSIPAGSPNLCGVGMMPVTKGEMSVKKTVQHFSVQVTERKCIGGAWDAKLIAAGEGALRQVPSTNMSDRDIGVLSAPIVPHRVQRLVSFNMYRRGCRKGLYLRHLIAWVRPQLTWYAPPPRISVFFQAPLGIAAHNHS